MEASYLIKVHGRVQGVWFRSSTREKAVELGLRGSVRNEPDGSVTIHVSGEKGRIDELIEWCKDGPPLARVREVVVEEAESIPTNEFYIER